MADSFIDNVGLLLHFDGTNASTTFTDNSPIPKTITGVGNVSISTTNSKFGGASAYFDGAGDYLTVPLSSALQPAALNFTYEFFFNVDDLGNYALFHANQYSGYSTLKVSLYAGNIYTEIFVGLGTSISLNTTNTPISASTWYHVALVRNGSNVSLYLNGVSILTGSFSGTIGIQDRFTIGDVDMNGSGRTPFKGYIDEFRVTIGVARYTANFTPPIAVFADVGVTIVGEDNSAQTTSGYINYTGNILTSSVSLTPVSNDVTLVNGYINYTGSSLTTAISAPPAVMFPVNGSINVMAQYSTVINLPSVYYAAWAAELGVDTVSTDQAMDGNDTSYLLTYGSKFFNSYGGTSFKGVFSSEGSLGFYLVDPTVTSNTGITIPNVSRMYSLGTYPNLYYTFHPSGISDAQSVGIKIKTVGSVTILTGRISQLGASTANAIDFAIRFKNGTVTCVTNTVSSAVKHILTGITNNIISTSTTILDQALGTNTLFTFSTVSDNSVNLTSGYTTYKGNVITTETPTDINVNLIAGQILYAESLVHIVAQTLRGGLTHANLIENTTSPFISQDLSEHAVDYWFPHINDTTIQKTQVAVTDNLPISMNTNTIYGDKVAHSYLHDFYYRIHSTITGLTLGNVLSEQVFQLQIWNSWLTNYSLTSVNKLNLPDVNLALPVTLPYTFTPLKFIDGTITVAAIGQAAIDGTYTLVFAGQNLVIDVSGQRVILWPFIPKTNFNETKQWSTDVLTSRHGEQRLSNREIPRRALQYNYTFKQSSEYVLAKQLANSMCHLAAATPLWSDVTYLTNLVIGQTVIFLNTTILEYYVNGLVVFWKSHLSYDIGEISAVYADRIILKIGLKHDYSSCWAAPTLIGYLPSGITLTRDQNQEKSCGITYNIVDSFNNGVWPVADTFLTLPVLTASSVVSGGLDEKFSRDVEVFDSQSGNFIQLDVEDYNRHRQSIQIKSRSVTELYNLRRMFDYLQGKYKTFWLPSYNNDYIATTDLLSAATSIKVVYSQLGTYPIGYVRITGKTSGGAAISSYFTVTGTISNTDGTDTIGLSPAVTTAIYNISRIDVMKKVRLDTDTVEFTHSNKRITTVKAIVVEVL